MNERFEQLLELKWAGQLSEQDRAELDRLCAQDEALAALRRQEERLDRMLAAHGPNRAPEGLAQQVLARLAAPEAGKGVDVSSALRRTASAPRPKPGLWSLPSLRWGAAMAVVLAIVVEAGILIHQQNQAGPGRQLALVKLVEKPAQPQPMFQAKAAPAASADAEATKLAAASGAAPAPTSGQNPPSEGTMVAMAQSAASASETPAPTPAEVVATPVPTPEPVAETPVAEAAVTIPTEEPTPTPAPVELDRRVAMRVLLASAGSPASVEPSAKRVSWGKFGQANGFGERQGFAPAATSPQAPAGASKAATRRDIEVAVAAAGGRIDSISPIKGQPDSYLVRCSLTPEQLAIFLGRIEQMGLPTVPSEKINPAMAAPHGGTSARAIVEDGWPVIEALSAEGQAAGGESASNVSAYVLPPVLDLTLQIEPAGALPPNSR